MRQKRISNASDCFLMEGDLVQVPTSVSSVPSDILDPAALWKNANEYNTTLSHLADLYKVGLRDSCH